MHCNKVSFQELLDCFDNDLGNNAWNLELNAEQVDITISKNQALQILYLVQSLCINTVIQC